MPPGPPNATPTGTAAASTASPWETLNLPPPMAATGGGENIVPSSSLDPLDKFFDAAKFAEGFGKPGALPTRFNNPISLRGWGNYATDPQSGLTQFPDLATGEAAGKEELRKVRAGTSKTLSPNMTLAQFGMKYSGGDPNWSKNAASYLGVPETTKVGVLLGSGGEKAAPQAQARKSDPWATLNLPAAQTTKPHTPPEGFWGAVGTDVGDLLKSFAAPDIAAYEGYKKGGLPGAAVGVVQSAAPEVQNAVNIIRGYQAEKKAGYSLPYRLEAGIARGLGIMDPSKMEAAAAQGDTRGVVGHAVLPTVLALSPLAGEALGKVGGEINENVLEPRRIATGIKKVGQVVGKKVPEVDLKTAAPDLAELSRNEGLELSGNERVGEAAEKVAARASDLWENAHKPQIERHPNAPVDLQPIVDAAEERLTPAAERANPVGVRQARTWLANFAKTPLTLSEADATLRHLNAEMSKLPDWYGNAGKTMRSAVISSLRDQIDATLQGLGEPGVRDINKRYGALTNIARQLDAKANALRVRPPRANPLGGIGGYIFTRTGEMIHPAVGVGVRLSKLAGMLPWTSREPGAVLASGLEKLGASKLTPTPTEGIPTLATLPENLQTPPAPPTVTPAVPPKPPVPSPVPARIGNEMASTLGEILPEELQRQKAGEQLQAEMSRAAEKKRTAARMAGPAAPEVIPAPAAAPAPEAATLPSSLESRLYTSHYRAENAAPTPEEENARQQTFMQFNKQIAPEHNIEVTDQKPAVGEWMGNREPSVELRVKYSDPKELDAYTQRVNDENNQTMTLRFFPKKEGTGVSVTFPNLFKGAIDTLRDRLRMKGFGGNTLIDGNTLVVIDADRARAQQIASQAKGLHEQGGKTILPKIEYGDVDEIQGKGQGPQGPQGTQGTAGPQGGAPVSGIKPPTKPAAGGGAAEQLPLQLGEPTGAAASATGATERPAGSVAAGAGAPKVEGLKGKVARTARKLAGGESGELTVGAPGKVGPISKALVEKFGTTDDPRTAGFILSDGRMVPLSSEHPKMLAATGGPEEKADFLNSENAIRTRFRQSRAGEEVVFSIPKSGVNEDQLSQMARATGKMRYGNVVMEVADPQGPVKVQEMAKGSDIPKMVDYLMAKRRVMDAAKELLTGERGEATSRLKAATYNDLAKMVAYQIGKGIDTLAGVSRAVLQDFAPKLRGQVATFLPEIYNRVKQGGAEAAQSTQAAQPTQSNPYESALSVLHDHPVRVKGFERANEPQVQDYFRRLRGLAERVDPSQLPTIDQAEAAYRKGYLGPSTAKSEQALSRLHSGAGEARVSLLSKVNGIPKKLEIAANGKAAQLAGNDAVSRWLNPEEKASLDASTKKQVLDFYRSLPKTKEFVEAAKAGEKGKDWYTRSATALRSLFGPDTERFVGLLSATSPHVPVQSDFRIALRIWDDWTEAGRPQDIGELRKIVGGDYKTPSALRPISAHVPNAIRALSDKPLSGQKVSSFYRNLLDQQDAVTNDTWMALFGGDRGMFSKKTGYLAMTAKVREAANELGWKPAETQAAVWSFLKTLDTMAGQRDLESSLGKLTDDRVQYYSRSFAELIHDDPTVRYLLNRLYQEGKIKVDPATLPRAGAEIRGELFGNAPEQGASAAARNPVLRRTARRIEPARKAATEELGVKRDVLPENLALSGVPGATRETVENPR